MFTLFDLNSAKRFEKDERRVVLKLVNEYYKARKLQWIKDLDIEKCKFFWCFEMDTDNGIIGAYSYLKNDSIFIMPPRFKEDYESWLEIVIDTIIHELRHKWQHKKYGLLYYLLSLPLIRNITIERDARKEEKNAQLFFDKIGVSV